MHPLWSIPELLIAILERIGQEDQVKCARVCRSFWAGAVPLIWRTLPSLHDNRHLKTFLRSTLDISEGSGDSDCIKHEDSDHEDVSPNASGNLSLTIL